VWLVWQGISGWPVFQEEYSDSAPAGEPDIAAAEPAGLPEEGPREAPGERAASLESDSTVPRTFVGAELPYSILMASYVDREDAEGQRRTLEDDGGLYLVAPTLIRGRLYFRVFAGAMADRFHAEELMRELVASGRKERARDWDMRPANLTFDLGTFASEDDATEVRDRLHEMHLPAYVLTDGAVPAPAYKVYSGAFETEEAAAVLDSLLRSSAQDAILVVRRGESR
jgi:cell division septation protein DedD